MYVASFSSWSVVHHFEMNMAAILDLGYSMAKNQLYQNIIMIIIMNLFRVN